MTTQAAKQQLRSRLKTVLSDLSPDAIREKSALVVANMVATSWWNEADTVLAFHSMPREVDTSLLLARAISQMKMVGIPRIQGDDLIFHQLRQLDTPLSVGPLNIREPWPAWPVLDIDDVSIGTLLIVTPGLGFDRQMNRLGRGKGFYDRFLRNALGRDIGNIHAIGVCFSEQLIESVPVSDHDIPVHGIITDRETLPSTGPEV
jgi:5-formyltetrahydrofolate cyclo-ligase